MKALFLLSEYFGTAMAKFILTGAKGVGTSSPEMAEQNAPL
jgi:hypothetical protein